MANKKENEDKEKEDNLVDGVYERIISTKLQDEIMHSHKNIDAKPIDKAEANTIYASYLKTIIEQGLSELSDKDHQKLTLTNKIIHLIKEETQDNDFTEAQVHQSEEQLFAVQTTPPRLPRHKTDWVRPNSSLSLSSIFTGAPKEPKLSDELQQEIQSSDEIYLLVSFIKWSGLVLIMDALDSFTKRGGMLKIITTTYMGATDAKAIEKLSNLPHTSIQVSYDTKTTRLHAKSYIFVRKSGFHTAYIGSSNLSNPAMTYGREWNVKITAQDQPFVLKKMLATFEAYEKSNEFEPYRPEDTEKLRSALQQEKQSKGTLSYTPFDIKPYHYQQEVLDKLQFERRTNGNYRNLVVAATGTGKTIICSFDYKNYCQQNPGRKKSLLFIAHRKEILTQSLATFRGVLKQPNFGELYTGFDKPKEELDHLFITVQSLKRFIKERALPPDYYDYIVVDETHHSQARSYDVIFNYFTPQILLGLTATPERMDGKDILQYFNHTISAELALSEAIDRNLLTPFHYFGCTDPIDLKNVTWTPQGYSEKELEALYSTDKRVNVITEAIDHYTTDMNDIIGLGFCVSMKHAQYMSDAFNQRGIPSDHLDSNSLQAKRENVKNQLVTKKIHFLFVVDLYNEGVDIPEINTVLFLRPTMSKTIFMQQLGRGLRLSDGKSNLTVLDFIGQANKKYRFENKLKALIPSMRGSVLHEMKEHFPSLPQGCAIKLERLASSYILENLNNSSAKNWIVARIRDYYEAKKQIPTVKDFLRYFDIDPRSIYKNKNTSFLRLTIEAGLRENTKEETEEKKIVSSLASFCYLDSRPLIDFIIRIIEEGIPSLMKTEERQMLNMFQYTIWDNLSAPKLDTELNRLLQENTHILSELKSLLLYQKWSIDSISTKVTLKYPCPLEIHGTYSRNQLFAGLDLTKPSTIREGVKYIKEKNTDVLLITLNKADKDYSETTMYDDRIINNTLIHWQSQSKTTQASATGQRYCNNTSTVLLFIRKTKKDNFGITNPYTFMGKAKCIKYEGNKPINITWKIDPVVPAKLMMEYETVVSS